MSNDLHNHLTLSYAELEEKNLKAKEQRMKRAPEDKIREERLKYLTDEKGIKRKGRLHATMAHRPPNRRIRASEISPTDHPSSTRFAMKGTRAMPRVKRLNA